jgi:hypothetical protein
MSGRGAEVNVFPAPAQAVEVRRRQGSDREVIDILLSKVAEDTMRGGVTAQAFETRFFTQRRARGRG